MGFMEPKRRKVRGEAFFKKWLQYLADREGLRYEDLASALDVLDPKLTPGQNSQILQDELKRRGITAKPEETGELEVEAQRLSWAEGILEEAGYKFLKPEEEEVLNQLDRLHAEAWEMEKNLGDVKKELEEARKLLDEARGLRKLPEEEYMRREALLDKREEMLNRRQKDLDEWQSKLVETQFKMPEELKAPDEIIRKIEELGRQAPKVEKPPRRRGKVIFVTPEAEERGEERERRIRLPPGWEPIQADFYSWLYASHRITPKYYDTLSPSRKETLEDQYAGFAGISRPIRIRKIPPEWETLEGWVKHLYKIGYTVDGIVDDPDTLDRIVRERKIPEDKVREEIMRILGIEKEPSYLEKSVKKLSDAGQTPSQIAKNLGFLLKEVFEALEKIRGG